MHREDVFAVFAAFVLVYLLHVHMLMSLFCQPLFLGLSFFVFDIEQAIALLKKGEAVPEARLEIQQIPGQHNTTHRAM